MIDAAPDVPNSGAQILDEGRPRRELVEFELPQFRAAAQDRGLRRAVREEREQTAMRRIFRIQQCVVDGQALERAAACGRDRQPQIAAVNAVVDLNVRKFHPAWPVGARQIAGVPAHTFCSAVLARPQFAPGTLPSPSRSRPDREFAIANRKLNRAGNLRAFDSEESESRCWQCVPGPEGRPAASTQQ